MENAKARLGILFLHGIGDQTQGSTLVSFGEPLVHWINNRYDGHARLVVPAGATRDEIQRWRDAVWKRWIASGREDILRLEPQLWRFQLDTYLDARKGSPPQTEEGEAGTEDIERFGKYTQGTKTALLGTAELRDVVLKPPPGSGAPAHAELAMRAIHVDGTVSETSWLLAESWWADVFGTPRFRDLVGRSLKLLPATAGLHFGAQVRRASRATGIKFRLLDYLVRGCRITLALAALFGGLLLAVAGLAVMFVLYPLALLPIAKLRAFAARVQRVVTATLGDSYVLAANPVKAAAIVSQMRRDLEWLAERAERIVIVAHSQGAAVSHLLLEQAAQNVRIKPDEEAFRGPQWLHRLDLLITLGSGVRKLEEMRRICGNLNDRSWQYAPIALLGPIALLALISGITGGTISAASVGILTFMLLIAGLAVSGLAHGTANSELERSTAKLQALELKWDDYFASADPVPNGNIIERDYPHAVPVHNRGSLFGDHTSYWENQDEFVSAVVASLGRIDDSASVRILEVGETAYKHAARNRRWRVWYLIAARRLALVSIAVAVITHLNEWALLEQWSIQKVSSWLVKLLPSELTWTMTVSAKPSPATIAATAGWVASLWAAYYAGYLLWRNWDKVEVQMFFNLRSREGSDKHALAFVAAAVAPLAFTLSLCLPEVFQPHYQAMFMTCFFAAIVAAVSYRMVADRREAKEKAETSARAAAR